jgi:biotin carboxyl carrier protein
MKLKAQVGDASSDLDIRIDGEKVFARVDDREYTLETSEVEPGVYLLKNNGRIYEAYVSDIGPGGNAKVTVRGQTIDVAIFDPKRLRSSQSDHPHGDGRAEIKTAMPGKVVRIMAEVGQTVEKGAGVIVVEAMKMQNEMRSPKDGVIKEIRTSEGATVNVGEVLVVIE